MKEIWKDIPEYEGYYQVSNFGRIKSKRGYIQKPILTKFGYLRATIYKNNLCKKVSIHRLVASSFIQNPDNKPEINHIDGNKQNNFINNLEWNTKSENRKHAFKIGLQSFKGSKNPNSKKVIDLNSGKLWDCAVDCARDLKINYNTLRNQLNGSHKNKTYFKYLLKN